VKVIVDTSIWSMALRRQSASGTPEAALLKRMIEEGESIFILGIILQEILQGVRLPGGFRQLKEHLDAFPLLPVRREHYVKAAELQNHLARNGVQAATIDALIAASAIAHDCSLFTNDRDFHFIARHSGLKLIRVP
jgi:predicted nucleic acid-binding protein